MGRLVVALAICLCLSAASYGLNKQNRMEEKDTVVLLHTTEGNIKIKLYGNTPIHRDNFITHVKDGVYDSVLFHRVINEFMIQAGDPSSKTAVSGTLLGASSAGEELTAEFVPEYFHKKGAIAAARASDAVNPEKKSSGSQFYIVTGKVYKANELVAMEKSMQNKQRQAVFGKLAEEHRTEILNLRRTRDTLGLQALQNELIEKTEQLLAGKLFHFSPKQKEIYATIGGTPFLDGDYTVFGEVVEGMDVVDKIQQAATDRNDRPEKDIRILKAEIVE